MKHSLLVFFKNTPQTRKTKIKNQSFTLLESTFSCLLVQANVLEGGEGGELRLSDELSFGRSDHGTLDVVSFTGLLGGSADFIVLLGTVKELLTALGVAHVFNAEVNALGENLVTDSLVHFNTDGALGDVPDDTSLTVVEFVWHTLVYGSVGLHVNDLTNLVDLGVSGGLDGTVVAETTRKHMTGTRSLTI